MGERRKEREREGGSLREREIGARQRGERKEREGKRESRDGKRESREKEKEEKEERENRKINAMRCRDMKREQDIQTDGDAEMRSNETQTHNQPQSQVISY